MTTPEGSLFGDQREPAEPAARDAALIDAYAKAGRTLDDLPYTREFESIMAAIAPSWPGAVPREVFHKLHNLRKASRLPRVGRAASHPPQVLPEDEQRLAALVVEAVGTLGQRDQLPFTPAFESLVQRFNAASGRTLDPHSVWRLIAKIAK